MSGRDELAAVLEEHEAVGWMLNSKGEQQWACGCGSGVGLPPEHHAHVADAVLAWLGEQLNERLRARVAEAINCEADWDVSGLGSADFGVIREMREHLGLEDPSQNAQDAP